MTLYRLIPGTDLTPKQLAEVTAECSEFLTQQRIQACAFYFTRTSVDGTFLGVWRDLPGYGL